MGGELSLPQVDLSGKVVVITGGNTGIGYETAKALAVMGAHTIIACRSEEKAVKAIHRMKEEVATATPGKPDIMVEYMHLDLSSFDSTRLFVTALTERNHPLHILINNAGISWVHYGRTEDGFEQHYQVNHLSHFLLTLELLPLMLETADRTRDGRIIFVSSRQHAHGVFDPTNMNGEVFYSRSGFYDNSKLYNVMTAYTLQRRLHNTGITVSAVHPGLTNTEMTRHMTDMRLTAAFVKTMKTLSIGWKSAQKGATTVVYCACNPDLKSQQCFYYSDCRVKQSSSLSRNEQLQEKLWEISVRAVKGHLSPEVLEKYGPIQASRGHSPHGHGSSRTETRKKEDCELLLKSEEDEDEMEREEGEDWENNAQQQTFYA